MKDSFIAVDTNIINYHSVIDFRIAEGFSNLFKFIVDNAIDSQRIRQAGHIAMLAYNRASFTITSSSSSSSYCMAGAGVINSV